MIEMLNAHVPHQIRLRSGKVFYSGRKAFSGRAPLYVLGVNPGGDPATRESETVDSHTTAVIECFPANWSAYRDESWRGSPPGTAGMQPRVLHLFRGLGLDPGRIPCSNLIFVRSKREGDMKHEVKALAHLCWAFHAAVIEKLKPRAVLCFGKTPGEYVCDKVAANSLSAEFVERNDRRWRSQIFVNSLGLKVIVATHPSIADWTASSTDPTQLVREALK